MGGRAGLVLVDPHHACWDSHSHDCEFVNLQASLSCRANCVADCAAAAPCFQVEAASPVKQPAAGKKGKKQQQKKAAAAAPAGDGPESMQE